jgi:hypothetical protein
MQVSDGQIVNQSKPWQTMKANKNWQGMNLVLRN